MTYSLEALIVTGSRIRRKSSSNNLRCERKEPHGPVKLSPTGEVRVPLELSYTFNHNSEGLCTH